jgi:hypothetical protein
VNRTGADGAPPRRAPRLVLAVGVLVGLTTLVGFPRRHPEQIGIATDVYVHAARALLGGGDVYAALAEHPGFAFRYPPLAAVAFVPHAALGDPALALALQTVLNLLSLGALAVLLVRLAERAGADLTRADRALVGAYALVATPVATNLVMGQVNPQLALAVGAGTYAVLDGRERAGGAAFGGAAFPKAFPALLGAWLLRQRAWRAVAVATATGVGLLLAGVVALGPDLTTTWATGVLSDEAAVATFADGPDPASPYVTVRRQVAVLAPWVPDAWLSVVGLAVLAPVVAAASRTVERVRDSLVALQATLLATLVLFPLEPFYLMLGLCPLVPLLYALEPGWPRRLFVAGALLLSVPVTYETVLANAAVAPPVLGDAMVSVARATFGYALPPMAGVWLVLTACVLDQRRALRRRG